jgi:hypothetical protein
VNILSDKRISYKIIGQSSSFAHTRRPLTLSGLDLDKNAFCSVLNYLYVFIWGICKTACLTAGPENSKLNPPAAD